MFWALISLQFSAEVYSYIGGISKKDQEFIGINFFINMVSEKALMKSSHKNTEIWNDGKKILISHIALKTHFEWIFPISQIWN